MILLIPQLSDPIASIRMFLAPNTQTQHGSGGCNVAEHLVQFHRVAIQRAHKVSAVLLGVRYKLIEADTTEAVATACYLDRVAECKMAHDTDEVIW